MGLRKLLGTALVVLLLTPAADAAGSAEPVVPPLLAAPTNPAPAGAFTQPCPWLSLNGPDRTLHIALPERFGSMSADRGTCYIEGGTSESVGIEPAVGISLRTFKETQIDPFVAEAGDDAVSDATERVLAARDDVRRLRRTSARQLDYVMLPDTARPRRVRVVQEGRVRVTLTSPASRWRHDRRIFDTLRDSLTTSSSSRESGSSTRRR